MRKPRKIMGKYRKKAMPKKKKKTKPAKPIKCPLCQKRGDPMPEKNAGINVNFKVQEIIINLRIQIKPDKPICKQCCKEIMAIYLEQRCNATT